MTRVEVLLWDCDGILQHGTTDDGHLRLRRAGGEDFQEQVWAAETPALRGERPFSDCLADLLAERHDVELTVEELLTFWTEFAVDEQARALLREVAASGVRCMLATNQTDFRAAYMRDHCRYEEIVEHGYYSCEVGAKKPEPAYFAHILADLRLPADRVGFVDDVEENVRAAARLGIRAVHHDPATGADGLRRDLAPLL